MGAIVLAIGVALCSVFGLFWSGTSKANESWKDIPTVETVCEDSKFCEAIYGAIISWFKDGKIISEDGKRWNGRIVLNDEFMNELRNGLRDSWSKYIVPIEDGRTQEQIEKDKEVFLNKLEKEFERIYKEMGIRVR